MIETAKKLEIICVGKELLMGKISNMNAHWLAKRARARARVKAEKSHPLKSQCLDDFIE